MAAPYYDITNVCVCYTRELMDVIKVIGKRMSLAHPSGKCVRTCIYVTCV